MYKFDISRPRASLSNSKDIQSTCVFRRYSGFETLRNYLVAKYSWIIVPVLPEKTVKKHKLLILMHNLSLSLFCFPKISHTWSKSYHDRTSVEVVERRRVLLEVEHYLRN